MVLVYSTTTLSSGNVKDIHCYIVSKYGLGNESVLML